MTTIDDEGDCPVASTLTTQQKIVGKARAIAKLMVVTLRFVAHPVDFLRLYHREAEVADSVLDIALISLEQEFLERIEVLEARVRELEAKIANAGSSE
jgi:hypothetical protein